MCLLLVRIAKKKVKEENKREKQKITLPLADLLATSLASCLDRLPGH